MLIVAGLTVPVMTMHVPFTFTVPRLTGPHALSVPKLIVPLCGPALAHVNRTVTVTLPPAGTVAGNAGLTIVNAPLLDVIVLIVNGPFPVLVTVNVRSALAPTHTSPKLIVRGFTSPEISTHEPATLTVPRAATGPHALVVTKLSVPLCGPAVVQANRTVTATLPPAGTVAGNAGAVIVNAPLLDVIALIVNGRLPVLLTVKVWLTL